MTRWFSIFSAMVEGGCIPSTTEYLKEIGMYLAIKEILQNKLRYSLILTTIFLIGFYGLFYDQFGSRACSK